jgi:hypothetical protein
VQCGNPSTLNTPATGSQIIVPQKYRLSAPRCEAFPDSCAPRQTPVNFTHGDTLIFNADSAFGWRGVTGLCSGSGTWLQQADSLRIKLAASCLLKDLNGNVVGSTPTADLPDKAMPLRQVTPDSFMLGEYVPIINLSSNTMALDTFWVKLRRID